ncbi:hydroxypyruvate isomerase family protein [Paludisphaera mucosa]|uniref:TIM barrel protein n=1 Tax=Paludisphaera mucosa TaxID=3030827 RepID=A0ABT6F7V8_9BACT|nr:TIM barrel protein [Paludisphaera mucosa]MDG3003529.1 TIM barrel protein [Paludisphaera mucosa]
MSLSSKPESTRRDLIRAATATVAAGVALGGSSTHAAADSNKKSAATGRLKQSVCRWCYGKIPLDELCSAAKRMGLVGIDLLGPADFATIKKYDLICTMVGSHPLSDGLCEPKFHAKSLEMINAAIEATSKEGWRNVICFSGNRRGIDDRVGMDNCVKALKEIVPIAEKAKIILNMELLNSKVDHADYMCDNSKWGVELVKRVGSNNFKLLYDIYHMQIMEGDVIRTIEKEHAAFGHYHTGGNPGRHEIDESQELNYKAIARAIADTKDEVYFAHEFIPARDPLTSLAEAVDLCVV